MCSSVERFLEKIGSLCRNNLECIIRCIYFSSRWKCLITGLQCCFTNLWHLEFWVDTSTCVFINPGIIWLQNILPMWSSLVCVFLIIYEVRIFVNPFLGCLGLVFFDTLSFLLCLRRCFFVVLATLELLGSRKGIFSLRLLSLGWWICDNYYTQLCLSHL